MVEGGKWDRRKFDWIETLISLRKLGYHFGSFLYLTVGFDERNTSRHIINVSKVCKISVFLEYYLQIFNFNLIYASGFLL